MMYAYFAVLNSYVIYKDRRQIDLKVKISFYRRKDRGGCFVSIFIRGLMTVLYTNSDYYNSYMLFLFS